MNKIFNHTYRLFVFFLFLLGTFINDHKILEFYTFFFFYIAIIAVRIIENLYVSKLEFIVQFFLFLVFVPYIITESDSSNSYSFPILMLCLYINFLPVLRLIIDWIRSGDEKFYFLHIFLSIASILTFLFFGERIELLFGRNVLYRIFAFVYSFAFITLLFKGSNVKIIVSYLLLSISMLSLGSRGGLIVLVFYLILMFVFINKKNNTYKYFVSTFVVIFLSMFAWYLKDIFRRAFYFDLNNASEAVRLGYFNNLFELFLDFNKFEFFFGIGSERYYDLFVGYPHNFFIEYIVFYGVIIGLLSLLVYFLFFINYKKIYLFPYFGILIGSFFSGDLFYNFTIISCLFLVVKRRDFNEDFIRRRFPQ